jgi:hypothetical protein
MVCDHDDDASGKGAAIGMRNSQKKAKKNPEPLAKLRVQTVSGDSG